MVLTSFGAVKGPRLATRRLLIMIAGTTNVFLLYCVFR